MSSSKNNSLELPADDIRAQIDRIIKSPELEKSQRLQTFLNYVVKEFLAGRAYQIKGFTIGRAVFGAGENFDPESSSIVRVEAGRLRQRLAEYYMASGRDDPIVIDIPKGTYVPRFTPNPQEPKEGKSLLPDQRLKSTFRNRWLAAGVCAFAILVALSWRYYSALERSVTAEMNQDKTQQLLQDSEAQILFQQAFILLMPPEDRTRLATSKQLFERVIDINSSFGGGYAGKSIAFSFEVIFHKSNYSTDDLRQALTLAKSAVELDPEYSLGYAALALAQSLNAKYDSTLSNVRRVVAIQPRDPNANAIASAALIISGMPSKAIDLLAQAIKLNPNEPRTPFLNLLAIAQFANGDFLGAAESIEKNLVIKGPTGPHMDVFLAATYARLGKDFEAQAVIEKLQRTNPDYQVESWLENFIKSKDELRAIVSKLQSLGLSKS